MNRRGFTLIELMISLVVTAIVGAALIQMTLSQGRFMSQQEAWRSARSVSRSGVNRMISDLRNVDAASGLVAAVAGGQDFTVNVPYAFGIMCANNAGVVTLSLLPVDSAIYNAPGHTGFAYRDAAGVYTYVPSAAPIPGAGPTCTAAVPRPITTLASINGSPAGQIVQVNGVVPVGTKVGSIFFLYRQIRYEFKASVAVPGRLGLWRTMVTGGATEELAAPFANTARVNFSVLNSAVAQAAVPALANVRGLELVLDGMSQETPAGSPAPKTVNLTTSVFFENRPD